VYGKIVIDERDSNQKCDLSIYAANLYTNCDDDISKMLFCNSLRGYWVCHR
jgi:hypothetical protein